ncbi:DNA polymerase III subunit beta [Paenibacillus thiaminolyticus]|uniref:DNA polymerase III subunit beta n=1 Tax=Paenibacillus thiaminolyticus TaxID=49283 RepID=UPI003D285824
MQIELPQAVLSAALRHVARAAAADRSQPASSGIMVDVRSDAITIIASRPTMRIQYEIPASESGVSIKRGGRILLPAAYLSGIVRKLPAGGVTLESSAPQRVSIACGSTLFRLSGLDPKLFPPLPDLMVGSHLAIPSSQLKRMIRQVSFAVSASDTRPVLTGVFCRLDGQRLRMLATDSIRFSSRHAPVAVMRDTDAPSAIIPAASLAELGRLLPDGDEAIGIRIGTGHMSFQAKQWRLHTALIDGDYPEVDKLLPRDYTTELIVETAPLREAIDRVVILAGGDSAMMLHLTNQHCIKLSCRNEGAGDAEEEVHLREMRGEPLSICVNVHYMRDVVRAAESAALRFKFGGPSQPIMVQPPDDTNTTYVITPLRSRF